MAATTTKLDVKSRSQTGSRAARRMRRSGRVPGVLYGGEGDSLCFDVDARELRVALASSGAVLDLSVGGAKATPGVLKEGHRDPVRGHTGHVGILPGPLDEASPPTGPAQLPGTGDR